MLKGKIVHGESKSDSIFLKQDVFIPSKYYEPVVKSAKISNNTFAFNTSITYPQMYFTYLSEDKDILSFRPGVFFIGHKNSKLIFDYQNGENGYILNETGSEYRNKFQPFLKAHFNPDGNPRFYIRLSSDNSFKVDSVYAQYIRANPDSYVALWHVIQRFFIKGHSSEREATLNLFSAKIKDTKLWKLINNDIHNALIKENYPFPQIELKDENFTLQKVFIPKNKVVVVDFWFNNCKPCLAAFPKLIDLYHKYKDKGFEIIGVSTDRSERVKNWKKVIQDYQLPWVQYLDENAVKASEMYISLYPTAILIDKKGNIINKKASLQDIETFLMKELN
ncbi:MAG: TlpA family protein disulfide reductase [Sphingobacterium sp.]|jgi:thiol-disulfide isomerase/thioredoxin|nr:TlpA family protein disulfide reductase [Sphingobacterium sp.]